jgi:hypothetical protein
MISLLPKRFSVQDARGQTVTAHALHDPTLAPAGIDARLRDVRRRIARRFRRGFLISYFIIMFPVIMLLPFLPGWLGIAGVAPRLAFGLTCMVVAAIPFGLLMNRFQSRHAPAAAREFLLDGLCPCCAYDLTTLAPDPDGLVTCPECGAAWRGVPRVTSRPAPTAASSTHA